MNFLMLVMFFLRYPFDKENFFNLASDYVLSRGQKLQEAALTCGDPVAAEVGEYILDISPHLSPFP